MGSVMSIITMGHSLGMLIGGLLGGLMMDWFQLRIAFGLGSAIMIGGIIIFLVCLRRIPLKEGR